MVNLIEHSEYEASLLQEMEGSFSENNFIKAIELANKYLVFDSKDSTVNLLKAESLINMEEYDKAINTLKTIKQESEKDLLYYTFARAYFLNQDIINAEKYIKKAINISENNFDYVMFYSQILHIKKDSKYLTYFLRALILSPIFFAETIATNWTFEKVGKWESKLFSICEMIVINKFDLAKKALDKLKPKKEFRIIKLILTAEILFQENRFNELNAYLLTYEKELKKYSRFYYYMSCVESYSYERKMEFINKAINLEEQKYKENSIIEYDIYKVKLKAIKYPEYTEMIYKQLSDIHLN